MTIQVKYEQVEGEFLADITMPDYIREDVQKILIESILIKRYGYALSWEIVKVYT